MKNLRYIGPFFRMNSLSEKEINGQLFYLSKEAVKTIVLQSKCGLVSKIRKNKSSSSIDISTNSNFSPLLCVYRKSSSNFIHSKNSNGFDEDTFKKEINPSTNALMTLCLLELLDYYNENVNKNFENNMNTMMQQAEIGKARWVITITENPIIGIVDGMYGEIMENLQKFAENEAKYMILFKRDYCGDYEKIEDEILKYNLKVLTRNEEGMILEKIKLNKNQN